MHSLCGFFAFIVVFYLGFGDYRHMCTIAVPFCRRALQQSSLALIINVNRQRQRMGYTSSFSPKPERGGLRFANCTFRRESVLSAQRRP